MWREVEEGVDGISQPIFHFVCFCPSGGTVHLMDETPERCPECGSVYRLIYHVEKEITHIEKENKDEQL